MPDEEKNIKYSVKENGKTDEEKAKKRKLLWLLLLLLLLLIIIAITVIAILMGNRQNTIPEFAPQTVDSNAKAIAGDKRTGTSDRNSTTMTYLPTVTIDSATGDISMLYKNPTGSNNIDVILELYITGQNGDEKLIAKSEKLPLGYEMKSMKVLKDSKVNLNPGSSYKGRYKVINYNHDSGERSNVDGSLEVTINVK